MSSSKSKDTRYSVLTLIQGRLGRKRGFISRRLNTCFSPNEPRHCTMTAKDKTQAVLANRAIKDLGKARNRGDIEAVADRLAKSIDGEMSQELTDAVRTAVSMAWPPWPRASWKTVASRRPSLTAWSASAMASTPATTTFCFIPACSRAIRAPIAISSFWANTASILSPCD